jgi:hypothetical protein
VVAQVACAVERVEPGGPDGPTTIYLIGTTFMVILAARCSCPSASA